MKKLLFIIFICFLTMSFEQIGNTEKVKFYYLGYERKEFLNDLVLLQFEIENKTNDTIYLSRKNIRLRVFKDKKEITEDKLPTYLPFIKPTTVKKELKSEDKDKYERYLENLKLKFANKLYNKNFASNTNYFSSKDLIIENIVEDCIVLLPNESIEYESGFYSKKFDKTCKISAKYSDNKRFTYFVDDSGKKIDVIN